MPKALDQEHKSALSMSARPVSFANLKTYTTRRDTTAPIPQANYLATLRVLHIEGGRIARVEWSGCLTPPACQKTRPSGCSRAFMTMVWQRLRAN